MMEILGQDCERFWYKKGEVEWSVVSDEEEYTGMLKWILENQSEVELAAGEDTDFQSP